MTVKSTIFSKLVTLIILLLSPVLILYLYTNKVSVDVVKDEIQSSSLSQLSFFLYQFDTTVEQLAMFPVILSSDPYIRDFIDRRSNKTIDRVTEQTRIAQILSLQSVSSAWTNDLTLFLPKEHLSVSSNIFVTYNQDEFTVFQPFSRWIYDSTKREESRQPGARFVRQYVDPVNAKSVADINTMIEVSFSENNITAMLNQVKSGGKGNPFLFHHGLPPIGSSTLNSDVITRLLQVLNNEQLNEQGHMVTELDGRQYYVFYVHSKQLDWYLVDYIPVENILSPITKTNFLFYTTLGLLLALGFLTAYLLYRNVQQPIAKLLKEVQRLKRGDLSTRIQYKPHNEFEFLFQRFNEMAEQIQDLVERVYIEKIRLNEATLKQLQAQINPHFLYNSLFFIINTAMLGDARSVVAMAQNLAEYYRYTTRMENHTAPLREEIKLVENYLTIHNLRMQRLHYEIEVSQEMIDFHVPRLLLQPIVENAIEHGVGNQPGDGLILITGIRRGSFDEITVEDNGAGMSEKAMLELEKQLSLPIEASSGCGVWNVHQRLHYAFGEGAGLRFAPSDLGGLKVTLTWRRGEPNVAAVDRG